MCKLHGDMYIKAWSERMPGIDRPENAEDCWRPSLSDHLRLASIKYGFDNRSKNLLPEPDWQNEDSPHWYGNRRYASAQLEQVKIYRRGLKMLREKE
jgi:hypothetical protein